jgi:hypothetical protein
MRSLNALTILRRELGLTVTGFGAHGWSGKLFLLQLSASAVALTLGAGILAVRSLTAEHPFLMLGLSSVTACMTALLWWAVRVVARFQPAGFVFGVCGAVIYMMGGGLSWSFVEQGMATRLAEFAATLLGLQFLVYFIRARNRFEL